VLEAPRVWWRLWTVPGFVESGWKDGVDGQAWKAQNASGLVPGAGGYADEPTRLSDIDVALQSVAWGTIPSTYVVCTEDRAIPPEYQEKWATERATAKIEVPFDHAPGLSHPTELANILTDIIAEAATTWTAR
jgi:hypothetical protein